MHRTLILAVLPALAACASAGTDYPSLAIRDVERAQGRFETVAPAPLDVPAVPTEYTGTLADRLAALESAASASHETFLARAPAASRAVRSGAGKAIASDGWASAQIALADLESARSNTAIPLGDLDLLMAARAVQAEDVAAIASVRQAVIAMIEEEDAMLAQLREQMT